MTSTSTLSAESIGSSVPMEKRNMLLMHRDALVELVSYIQTKALTMGKCAVSVVGKSIVDTRNSMFLICIALLDAIDYIQAKLDVSIPLVRQIKQKLIEIIEDTEKHGDSMPDYASKQQASPFGNDIAQAKIWNNATANDFNGFVTWITSVIHVMNEYIVSLSNSVGRRAFVLVSRLPGVGCAHDLFLHTWALLVPIISSSQATQVHERISSKTFKTHKQNSHDDDRKLTAVVVSYREKEESLPKSLNKRIQRMMHFQVSLRPFEATVILPSEHLDGDEYEKTFVSPAPPLAVTPQSIPASPLARLRVQTAFSNFIDDIVYQARDQLRFEQAESLSGEPQARKPTFNPNDAHPDIYLSCGNHCASKIGTGLYRSVRATSCVKRNRYVYFEFSISKVSNVLPGRTGSEDNSTSICIGLSTQEMPLNTLVGTWKHSVGFYSSGHIIAGSQWHNYISTDISYSCGNTVGLLVHVSKPLDSDMAIARTIFSINGSPLSDGEKMLEPTTFVLPDEDQIFPTITLFSSDTRILSRFTSDDLLDQSTDRVGVEPGEQIFCLDDTLLKH